MNKVDESSKSLRFVVGLEDATLEQKLVFQSVVLPDIMEVFERHAPLLTNAEELVTVTSKPVEKM